MTQSTCQHCGILFAPVGSLDKTCPKCLLAVGLDATEVVLTDVGATALPAPDSEELAAILPDYEILEVVGRGGMGAVYKARHKKLDRLVAIKVLLPSLQQDEAFSERFLREARTLAGLNHPGIVTIFDFGHSGDLYYFAMEFVVGVSLRTLMHDDTLTPQQALDIVGQVSSALQYAHDQGVVHRDIKPDNILINTEGQVKITDFGLAKMVGSTGGTHLTRTNQVMGTPHYMAPEQIERPLDVDHRADIYSLGVVFYELLTRELPLGRFNPPSKKTGIDARLDDVVLKALEKEPAQRFQKAGDVRSEVERVTKTGSAKVEVEAGEAPKDESKKKPVERPKIETFDDWVSFLFGEKGWRYLEWEVHVVTISFKRLGQWFKKNVRGFSMAIPILVALFAVFLVRDDRRPKGPFITFLQDQPVVTQAFVDETDLSNKKRNEIDRILKAHYEQYARTERQHTTEGDPENGRRSFTIETFEQDLAQLILSLRTQLEQTLSSREWSKLRHVRNKRNIEDLEKWLFPYGRTKVFVKLLDQDGVLIQSCLDEDGNLYVPHRPPAAYTE